jgi:adenylosuccinate synthase
MNHKQIGEVYGVIKAYSSRDSRRWPNLS